MEQEFLRDALEKIPCNTNFAKHNFQKLIIATFSLGLHRKIVAYHDA